VGWSTVHLGVAGLLLDVVEPQLTHDPRVLLQIVESIRLAKVSFFSLFSLVHLA